MNNTKIAFRTSKADQVFNVLNWVMLTIAFLCVAYPLVYIISCSLSSPHAVTGGRVWLWPVEPTTVAYSLVFKYQKIWNGYLYSILYTIVGTALGVVGNLLAAYPLARKELRGAKFFSAFMLFTMLFNGGLIPTYLWIKQLGMVNTIWVMALPWAVSPWNIVIMRTYFKSNIPQELYESAELDGCSDIRFMFRILIPLSGAILAVIALFYAVWFWNSYFIALIYLNDERIYPLQIILRDILIVNTIDSNMIQNVDQLMRKQGLADVLRYSLIVVASLPLLIIYPFVQRYFIKGVMIGSLKG